MDLEILKVKIDALVVQKIIKHSKENPNRLTTGQLQGVFLQNEKVVEVSFCYAIPTKEENEDRIDDIHQEDYDKEMMSKHSELNLDNNLVGWYQVSYKNDHFSSDSFSTHYPCQKEKPFSIFLVYDVLESSRGSTFPFKAFRIKKKIFQLIRNTEKVDGFEPFTIEKYKINK